MSMFNKEFLLLTFLLLVSSVAVAHTDGIFNSTANSVGDTQGIDSRLSSGVAALSCNYIPITSGTQGVAYTGATPAASGGVPAYTFSETGSLPTGLTINSGTGVISGTPSVNGSFPNIQVKVTDTSLSVVNCGLIFTLTIAPPAFQGPLDIVASPTGWWGLRAASAANRGTKAIKLCDPTSVVCADWFSDAVTGNLVATTNPLNGTDCTAVSTCRIDTWYDQSGGGHDLIQAAPTLQLTLTPNCINTTLYCASDNGSQVARATFAGANTQPFTAVGVGKRTANFTSFQGLYGDTTNSTSIGWSNAVNTALLYNFVALAGVSDSVFHAMQGIAIAGANASTMNVDNTTATGTETQIMGATRGIGTGLSVFTGSVTEVGEWPIGFTGTQQTNMCHNLRLYYGTPGAC